MADDEYKEINEKEEQINAELDSGKNIDIEQGKNNQDEALNESSDSAQNTDKSQSFESVQSSDTDTTQSNDIIQNSDIANSDSSAPADNINIEAETKNRDTDEVYNETQKIWQMQKLQSKGQDFNSINNTSYYKESYKNPNNKRSDAWKYVLVSLLSAIVGGAILSVMLFGVAPRIQPQLKSFFGNANLDSNNGTTTPNVSEVKKVEIVQTSDSAVTSVAEKVGPSVVGIRTTYQSINEFFGEQSDGGEGSGIIISSDGYILTNHHVVEKALNNKTRDIRKGSKIEVYLPNKIDKPYTAVIKGYDAKTDLAVLKINETNLAAIEFGDSDSLKIGEPAIAFGNPGGLEYIGSLTTGVISGLNRTVQLDGGKKIKLVQTDAAINPGNSGGALVNIKGQLIGVNTIKMVATGFEGLGFAIPVNDAKKIADELIINTYISKPYLGISVNSNYTEEIAKANNMPMGVFVADVEILGAAQKAGIKALDVIIKFNKKAVTSYDELETEKNKLKPGDIVEIELYRDGNTKKVQVKLGETK